MRPTGRASKDMADLRFRRRDRGLDRWHEIDIVNEQKEKRIAEGTPKGSPGRIISGERGGSAQARSKQA